MTVGHRSLLGKIGRALGMPEPVETQADYGLAPPGRRACTVEDLTVDRSPFADGLAWYWACRNCPNAGGHVFAAVLRDGQPRARRDAWDLARAHLAGQKVCRPRVRLRTDGLRTWAWTCEVAGTGHRFRADLDAWGRAVPHMHGAIDDARAHVAAHQQGDTAC